MKTLLIAILLTQTFMGCATIWPADMIHEKNGFITLGYYTGALGKDRYDSHFHEAAKKACKGVGYEVVEKSFNPSTLKNYKNLDSGRFYWVVKCTK